MRQSYALRVALDHDLLELLEAQLAESLPVPLAYVYTSMQLLFIAHDQDVVELLKLGVAHLFVQRGLRDVQLHFPAPALQLPRQFQAVLRVR